MLSFKKYLFVALLMVVSCTSVSAASQSKDESSEVDVKEIVLGHMSDAYEWHITTWNGVHVSIPLPVILYSEHSGWHIFLSSVFHHALNGEYEGFYIDNATGKIYEHVPGVAEGEKPWDFSITKDVVQIWFVVFIMLGIFISSARWYKKHKSFDESPKGLVGLVEMFVMMVNDDIIKACIGAKHYKPYAPFLLTVFFFIFLTNLMGLIPTFPGGANVTGHIVVTFFLALCTFLLVNLFGNKEYWKEIFWPDVPTWLKVPVPLMPVIEFFGILTKPFALMVRLFANMMGGHAIILASACVIFITCQVGMAIGVPMTAFSFILMVFMNCLELLVAFIQAYVFTMLSSIFIGLAHPEHHK